jgi:hypothetical protein
MSAPFNGVFDDPYDPNSQSYQPETDTLDQVIRKAVNAAALELHTWLPAVVTQVLGNQRVNIQPLLQRRYVTPSSPTGQSTSGTLVKLPAIQNVMVGMPMGAGYSIKLPVKVGDTGIALFCERSLDNWSNGSGSFTDPADVRHHDLSDAIFIPGIVPFANQTMDDTDDLVVTNGEAQLRVQEAGTFQLKNETNELLSLLSQLAAACSEIANVAGPTFNAAAFVALQAQIDTLKGS